MPQQYRTMDDAAAAFAFMLPYLFPESLSYEFASGLVPGESGFSYSGPRTSRQRRSFSVPLPATMRGLIHNHPALDTNRGHDAKLDEGTSGERFSVDDKNTAHQLRVPSYVRTPDGNVSRYNPATRETEQVLAEFPWEEFKAYLIEKRILRSQDELAGMLR